MNRKYLLLDRDGVINHDSDDFIRTAADWRAIDGSLDAIARLSQSGWHITVITNQSGIGRGLYSFQDLAGIHGRFRRELAAVGGHVDALLFCPHAPDFGCRCRKPAPGLFEEAAALNGQALANQIAIGDTLRDLQAARTAGARPVLVETGNGAETLRRLEAGEDQFEDLPVFADLAAAADALLAAAV